MFDIPKIINTQLTSDNELLLYFETGIIKDIIQLEVFSKIHNHSSGNGSGIVDRIKRKTLDIKKVLLKK